MLKKGQSLQAGNEGKKGITLLIRNITDQDIKWVTQSIQKENWGYLEKDVRGCFDIEPEGCFVAETDGKKAGHVFSVCYEHFSWISLVIVDSRFRKKGVASALMTEVITYLEHRGSKSIFLESVPAISDLYRKFGFEDQFDSIRFMLTGIKPSKPDSDGIRPVQKDDLEKLEAFDRKYFGNSREKVLRRMIVDYSDYCFLFEDKNEIEGLIFARKTINGFWIGPLTCHPDKPWIAKSLMETMIYSFNKENIGIKMGVPSVNTAAVSLISSMSFSEIGRSIRMLRGGKPRAGNLNGIFGIGGPEKG